VLWDPESGTPLGTCFAFRRPGIFLTAAHAVTKPGYSVSDLEVLVPNVGAFRIGRAIPHATMDAAVIVLRPDTRAEALGYFQLAEPPEGLSMFPPSQDVASYGYALNSHKCEPEARWRQGYVQCHIDAGAYELSYPSFPGNSGSPVMLSSDPGGVIALTYRSRNISYKNLSADDGHDDTDDKTAICLVSYTLAVALNPISDWLMNGTS